MHPSAAIAFAATMMYGPWAPMMLAPYVAAEMWRLMLTGNGMTNLSGMGMTPA